MMNEQKMERLLRMMEHPELYSDSELEALMRDEECRKAYELMIELETSAGLAQGGEMQTATRSSQNGGSINGVRVIKRWWKMAAIFVGVMMMAGFAFAAIHLATRHQHSDGVQTTVVRQAKKQDLTVEKRDSVKRSSPSEMPREMVFADLLADLANHYHLTVTYKNDNVRHLRIFYKWEKTRSIEEIVADLNHFEHIHLTLKGQELIAE